MNSPHQSKHKFNRESDRTRFDEKKGIPFALGFHERLRAHEVITARSAMVCTPLMGQAWHSRTKVDANHR